MDRAGPERVGVRGPARDRDAGALGRKASGGLSVVGRLLDTGVLRVACWSRRGRRAGGGVGAPHLGRGGGSGGRRLQPCPPDIAAAPAAGGRDETAAGLAAPATPSLRGVWTGLFSYPLESVGWIPCPFLALPFPPPRALCSVPAGDACGFAVWDRLFFGQISTCKEGMPRFKVDRVGPDTHPHPRACCPPCPDN